MQTIQAIKFLSRTIQYLTSHGLTPNAMLIQKMDTDCAKLYKYVQFHLTKTKSSAYDSRAIELPVLKRKKMPNYLQFSNWMQSMASTLDKSTYFYGFTPFSYMVRESHGNVNNLDLDQEMTFSDHCRPVPRLEVKHFEKKTTGDSIFCPTLP